MSTEFAIRMCTKPYTGLYTYTYAISTDMYICDKSTVNDHITCRVNCSIAPLSFIFFGNASDVRCTRPD